MFCKYCGKEIEEDSIFCKHCGKQLIIEEKKNNDIDKRSKHLKYCYIILFLYLVLSLSMNAYDIPSSRDDREFLITLLSWFLLFPCCSYLLYRFCEYKKFSFYLKLKKKIVNINSNLKKK